jgi:prevent-host-death family protein
MPARTVTEARQQWSDLVDRVAHHGERILLTRNKKDVAALVSPDDVAVLEALEDKIDLEEALRRLQSGRKPMSFEEFCASLGL